MSLVEKLTGSLYWWVELCVPSLHRECYHTLIIITLSKSDFKLYRYPIGRVHYFKFVGGGMSMEGQSRQKPKTSNMLQRFSNTYKKNQPTVPLLQIWRKFFLTLNEHAQYKRGVGCPENYVRKNNSK